jgi:DNA primase
MTDRRDIDEIRNRISIVDIVGENVALKRAGSTYKGLCPFHNEKSPSFTVNNERGLYKCFGCGESGDIFSFVMKQSGLSFPEALEDLARRAGVTLTRERGRDSGQRDAILDLNATAMRFYSRLLMGPEGEAARAYLAQRGIDAASIEAFHLGLAPAGWDVFFRTLGAKAAPELVKVSGLFRERPQGGWYDLFRDRIIFPILDAAGRPVAFGGRSWHGEEKGPKYINSPETPVYTKGRLVYGVHQARDGIKRAEAALLMEGYTDVIMAHRRGFTNAVAALGTALTVDQVALLARLAPRIVLVYDPDAAGRKAAERGIDLALDRGLTVRVASLVGSADPAELLLAAGGAEEFGKAITKAEDFLEYRITRLLDEAETALDRAKAARSLIESLRGITDRIVRGAIIRRVSERFGVPEEALVAVETAQTAAAAASSASSEIRKVARGLDSELHLLRLILDDPDLRREARTRLQVEDFSKAPRRQVFAAILEADAAGEELRGDLGGRVEGLGLELLAHITNAETASENRARLFEDYIDKITLNRIDGEINSCTTRLGRSDLEPDDQVETAARLSMLLKRKREANEARDRRKGTA